jgi:mRNA interferase YafQ
MRTVERTGEFRRGYRRAKKRGYDLGLLEAVIDDLAAGRPLATKYRDHKLKGEYSGLRECHVGPDWVLVYRLDRAEGVILLHGVGTHAELQLE